MLFSNKIEQALKPSLHPSHLKFMLHALETMQPEEKTDISDVFLQLASQVKQRGMVILFSDLFVDMDSLKQMLEQFRLRRHEVVVFHAMHHHELEFPFEDNTLFKGLEIQAQLHTEPRALRQSYLEAVERYMTRVKKTCASGGIDHVLLDTSKPLDAVLSTYMSFRQKSRRNLLRR